MFGIYQHKCPESKLNLSSSTQMLQKGIYHIDLGILQTIKKQKLLSF